jgi:hypothetical protein
LENVRARLSEDGRYYLIDDIPSPPLPRVSTILDCAPKGGLLKWYRKVGFEEADRVSKRATDLGTRVHAACEAVDLGLPYETDDELEPFVGAWRRFKDEHVAEVEAVEYFVYSLKHQYAGTVDRRLRLKDGRRVIGDLKTSKTLSPTYGIQMSAYAEAEVEMGHSRCDGRIVIKLPSNSPGKYGVKEYDDPNDWIAFRALNYTFRYFRDREDDWKRSLKLA